METRFAAVWDFGDFGDPGGMVSHTNTEQEAIPWCTTHDSKWFDVPAIMAGCYAGNQFKPCVDKSTGGPDHKWWKDSDGT